MLKFHRNYQAVFYIEEIDQNNNWQVKHVLTIQNPTTCNFNTEVSISGQGNSASLQFVNLDKDTRALMLLDGWNFGTRRIFFSFYLGYGYPGSANFVQALVFKGRVMTCFSTKASGSTDWLTDIQAIPSDLSQLIYMNETFSAGTSLENVLNYMLQRSEIELGYVTPELGTLPRNKTMIGQPLDLLQREYGGYEVFIDKGQLNILSENDVIPGDLLVITDASGLLGTPKRSWQLLEIDMLLEPQLRIGQAVSLLSDLMPELNQAYKIMGIKHSGTISERVGGRAVTTLTLFSIANIRTINTLKPAKPTTYEKPTDTAWLKPVKGPITSPFGWRIHPISKQRKLHEGMDIGADMNTPIYAPSNGIVIFQGRKGGYGNFVLIDNGTSNGIKVSSGFGHMNRIHVRDKQEVFKGKTIIGYVGSTGYSTGPHLHFEVRENGKPVNPAKYIGN